MCEPRTGEARPAMSEPRSGESKAGGSAWESNPACPTRRAATGFEDREGHRAPFTSVLDDSYQHASSSFTERLRVDRQVRRTRSSAPAVSQLIDRKARRSRRRRTRAGDPRACDVVRRVANHDHVGGRKNAASRTPRRAPARTARARCDPPSRLRTRRTGSIATDRSPLELDAGAFPEVASQSR